MRFRSYRGGRLQALAIIAGLFGVMLVAAGCDLQPPAAPPTVNVNVYNTAANNPASSSPSSPAIPPPAGCKAVASVGVSARDANNIVVGSGVVPATFFRGQTYALDASPKDIDGKLIEPSSCHSQSGTWTVSPVGICKLLGQTSGFNPQLNCPDNASTGDIVVRFVMGPGPGEGLANEIKGTVK